MKRISFFILIFFILMPVSAGFAQNPVGAIDALVVNFWPDYDRPSVLVLLTGTLAEDTKFPADVTLPLPKTARINAVARIDGSDGMMKDDIVFNTGPAGRLTFTTSEFRFRVEYYFPYTVNNNRRSFDFTWLADLSVNKFQLRVQQPISASSLSTEPATANMVRGENGFDYQIFSERAVPAGETFSLHVDYEMTTDRLSVESLSPPKTDGQTSGTGINLAFAAIVIGGLIVVVSLVWQLASRRPSPLNNKSADTRVEKRKRSGFCRNCGEPVGEGDSFCSVCGTEL